MSLSEIFLDALSNTLLGMGTVFAVLIIIILCIMLMSKCVRSFEGKGKKDEPAPEAPETAAPPVVPEAEAPADDLELVAVIAAAIAASENKSPEGFVVRSIRKANKRNWRNA